MIVYIVRRLGYKSVPEERFRDVRDIINDYVAIGNISKLTHAQCKISLADKSGSESQFGLRCHIVYYLQHGAPLIRCAIEYCIWVIPSRRTIYWSQIVVNIAH